jgi:hypothetical protein
VVAKIQSICNGKCVPITMQRFEWMRKKPPAQEQWITMEKTMRKTIESSGARLCAQRGRPDSTGEIGHCDHSVF